MARLKRPTNVGLVPFETKVADPHWVSGQSVALLMKFHIEIVRRNGGNTDVIYSAAVEEMNPSRAKMKAAALLNLYAGRGANAARVLNDKKEELYKL